MTRSHGGFKFQQRFYSGCMTMNKQIIFLSAALALIGSNAKAEDRVDAPGAFNPIVPGYFADPTIKKFGDTYYLYATTDGNGGGRGPSQVWMSHDFVNWTLAPMNWPASKTENYWAPDVVKRPDGHYYLYFNQLCITFGGVGDTIRSGGMCSGTDGGRPRRSCR